MSDEPYSKTSKMKSYIFLGTSTHILNSYRWGKGWWAENSGKWVEEIGKGQLGDFDCIDCIPFLKLDGGFMSVHYHAL